MPLSDDIRSLADQVLDRLDQAREFYVHSRQAWRLVQQLARNCCEMSPWQWLGKRLRLRPVRNRLDVTVVVGAVGNLLAHSWIDHGFFVDT